TRVLILGLGKKQEVNAEVRRRAYAAAAKIAQAVKAKKIIIPTSANWPTQAVVEGLLLGSYQFLKYRSKEDQAKKRNTLKQVLFLVEKKSAPDRLQQEVKRGQLYAQGTIFARDLVNEPAVHLTPKTFAKYARALAKHPTISVKVYGEASMKKMKMNALLAVSQGSEEDGQLIHLKYTPAKKSKNLKKVAICGKGVTFDSGGINIKPSGYIEEMKCDMGGAAAVFGLFSQIAFLQPQIEVHGIIASVENMISGKAIRPGDVITAYNGKTIEINNTDAEGRLVVAEALAWAEKTLAPDYLLDVATLTGACMIALGYDIAGMFSADKNLLHLIKEASEAAGEPIWQLPIWSDYKFMLESQIADMKNTDMTRMGGAIEGALFLQEFVKKTPWLHLDIAGPGWAPKPHLSYLTHGGTGFGVRTLMNFVQNLK
ncbi:MAG: hypothetical protein A2458_02490, partial [Candidatus Kerfeldbacteria bacterium RIFOXYC2_FULL_38_9]